MGQHFDELFGSVSLQSNSRSFDDGNDSFHTAQEDIEHWFTDHCATTPRDHQILEVIAPLEEPYICYGTVSSLF